MEAIGSAENMDFYLKAIAKRLALLMLDDLSRTALMEAVGTEPVGLADVLAKTPRVAGPASSDFREEIDHQDMDGSFSVYLVRNSSDTDALADASEALFGLLLTVMLPENVTWDPTEPLPVFHNPVLDESVTTRIEGFNQDGTQTSFSASVDDIPYPLLYLSYDEEFFSRPENVPDAEDAETSMEDDPQPLEPWYPFRLNLIARAYAHRSNTSTHKPCYDEYEVKESLIKCPAQLFPWRLPVYLKNSKRR